MMGDVVVAFSVVIVGVKYQPGFELTPTMPQPQVDSTNEQSGTSNRGCNDRFFLKTGLI